MLTYFFTDKNGKRCEIKNVLTAEILADVDVPADELVMTVPYDEGSTCQCCVSAWRKCSGQPWNRCCRRSPETPVWACRIG